MTTIQIELPDATAQAARAAGLLTPQALERLLGDQAVVVVGVAQLVGDGEDLVERAVEVDQDAGLLDERQVGAEGPAALAGAGLGVDPALLERAARQPGQVIRERGKLFDDEALGLLE